MATSINRAILVGNLTRDPELRVTQSGTDVCDFALAVNDRVKQNDVWVDRPDFFDIRVYGGQAPACGEYLQKGSQVAVDGRIRQERWEQDGKTRTAVRIIVNGYDGTGVRFLARTRGGGGQSASDDLFDPGPPGGSPTSGDFTADDDIPF